MELGVEIMFPDNFLARYSRQIVLREIGLEGQKRLSEKSIVIIGLGALGTVSANLLTRMGVGHIRLVDRDFVELDNLHRQILYDESHVERKMPKAEAAAERLKEINSDIELEPVVEDVNHRTIEKLVKDVDLIVDGTDNFETRFLINDAALKHNIPWVYASAIRTYGMTMDIVPGETACLRCFVSEPPPPGSLPTCESVGVLPSITHIMASIQVAEVIKILLGLEYSRELLVVDVWTRDFIKVNVTKKDDCPACAEAKYEFLEGRGYKATVLCGRNSVQIIPSKQTNLDLKNLAERLRNVGEVKYTKHMLHLAVPPYELAVFRDGRAIVKGTTDESVARALYTRYVGI